MPLKIGITGGIGTGKSTISHVFEVLGVPVYYADDAGKQLMNNNIELKQAVKAKFGEDVYNPEGQLDRKKLAAIVFNNPSLLQELNAIVHPATIAAADEWMQHQTAPYVLKEAALLFESDAHLHVDKVIGVQASLSTRIKRVIERDGVTEKEVMDRIARQMDETEKLNRCDYLINNEGNELVIPQVLALHQQLLALSTSVI